MKYTVVEARGLLPKGKKGEPNSPYCTLKMDQRLFRTRTIRGHKNPVWNEQFFFDISSFEGVIKLYLWHEEADSVFKVFGQEDGFLGKIDIPLAYLQDPNKTVFEDW